MKAAVLMAVNLAASNASLPVRFDTDDDALTAEGEVSYVNVNATLSVELSSSTPSGGQASAYLFEVVLLEVSAPHLVPTTTVTTTTTSRHIHAHIPTSGLRGGDGVVYQRRCQRPVAFFYFILERRPGRPANSYRGKGFCELRLA